VSSGVKIANSFRDGAFNQHVASKQGHDHAQQDVYNNDVDCGRVVAKFWCRWLIIKNGWCRCRRDCDGLLLGGGGERWGRFTWTAQFVARQSIDSTLNI